MLLRRLSCRLCAAAARRRHFTSWTPALLYQQNGPVADVLKLDRVLLPDVKERDVKVKMLAAPINPADINQIEGVYPLKPSLPAVGGNEGVAEVVEVGSTVHSLRVGDWVIPTSPGFGTWRASAVADCSEFIKIPSDLPLETAATLAINPATAFRMLNDFVDLKPGDCVIQNAANSGVGLAVIQLAAFQGIKTINIIRERPGFAELVDTLKQFGATEVVSDSVAKSREFAQVVQQYPKPRLGLNAVGGQLSTSVARALSNGGTMVTYGGMSKRPVTIPTGLFIFNDIVLRGFWLSCWTKNASIEERTSMMKELADLAQRKVLVSQVEYVNFSKMEHAMSCATKSHRSAKTVLLFD